MRASQCVLVGEHADHETRDDDGESDPRIGVGNNTQLNEVEDRNRRIAGGHQRAERRRAAQRAADAGELRAAGRPRGTIRAAALVVTYCATGNAHDQYYFRRPTDMVGGSVAPPRLDLANEDLVRSHVHAIWLAETGQDLRGSLTDVLDVGGDQPQPGTPARGTRAARPTRLRRSAPLTGSRPCSPG